MHHKRMPAVSGMFYPDDANELKALISQYTEYKHTPNHTQKPRFLVSPHAGYVYSGSTAGKGYAALKGLQYDRAILLGPSHRYYFDDPQASDANEWITPLGSIQCTPEEKHGFALNRQAHSQEHCLEVQVPFIQYLFPEIEILPLLLSGSKHEYSKIADQLMELNGEDTLWVISSDFTHFGDSFQYTPANTDYGEKLDQEAIRLIQNNDQNGFIDFLSRTDATICGALPILTAMNMIEKTGLPGLQLIDYSNSRQLTGGDTSVGYASLIG